MHFWISVTIQSKLPKETDYGELISHTVGDFHLVLIAWSHFTGILKQTYALRFYNRLSTPARKSVSASCVRTCSDCPLLHCPLLHCPPLPYHADKSTPALSTLATWCQYFHSRTVHPCHIMPISPFLQCQPLTYRADMSTPALSTPANSAFPTTFLWWLLADLIKQG